MTPLSHPWNGSFYCGLAMVSAFNKNGAKRTTGISKSRYLLIVIGSHPGERARFRRKLNDNWSSCFPFPSKNHWLFVNTEQLSIELWKHFIKSVSVFIVFTPVVNREPRNNVYGHLIYLLVWIGFTQSVATESPNTETEYVNNTDLSQSITVS